MFIIYRECKFRNHHVLAFEHILSAVHTHKKWGIKDKKQVRFGNESLLADNDFKRIKSKIKTLRTMTTLSLKFFLKNHISYSVCFLGRQRQRD